MKEAFITPEVVVLRFAESDIICTSAPTSCGTGGGQFETPKDSLFG